MKWFNDRPETIKIFREFIIIVFLFKKLLVIKLWFIYNKIKLKAKIIYFYLLSI